MKHTFEYNATLSFLFSCLEKAFTRVVSSLILAFKSLMSSALFCCLLARLCLEALKLDLLVADRILFSACSRLARSGIIVVNFCLRALMASVSALTFFSCCWIMSWRRACSACSRMFRKSVLKFWSGLRCGLGRYWRPTGQELLLTCSFRTQSDFLALARLVSR